MQYKIPQNVRREDQIVGPLTLKQLIILGVGGGISYAFYVLPPDGVNTILRVMLALPPAILTLALTFLKINSIPFAKWVLLGAEYLSIPRKRFFQLGAADVYQASIFSKEKTKAKTKAEKSKEEKDRAQLSKLNEISKVLDNYGKPTKQL